MAADDMALPANIVLTHHGSDLAIVWKWSRPSLLVLGVALFFTWNIGSHLGFDGIHWESAISDFVRRVNHDPFPFNLFGPIFSGAMLWMLYFFAAQTLNRTRISVSRARVVVHHGPLPWLGNRDIESSSIKQIFTRINLTRNRGHAGGLFAPYDLLALGRNDETIKLLSGLSLTREQASYLEQKLERYLGIKDAPLQSAGAAEENADFFEPDRIVTDPTPTVRRPIDASVVQVERGTQLAITRRWYDARNIAIMIAAVGWTAFSFGFGWVWLTNFGLHPLLPIEPNLGHAILVLHLGVGLAMLYWAMANLLNRTELNVSRDRISVRHGPIPWRGNGEFPLANLQALKVQRALWGSGKGANVVRKLELHAAMRDGTSKKLIGGFSTQDQALGVKQEIERYLKI